MAFDKKKFSFRTEVTVRNYEVDWQGIVHNAIYLYYFETGRISYFQKIGVPIDLDSIRRESLIVVARNEVDYFASATFGDTLDVFSRISFVRNSSFAFEGILENQRTGERVAQNVAIHVWLDPKTKRPTSVSKRFRDAVRVQEGENAVISLPSEEV